MCAERSPEPLLITSDVLPARYREAEVGSMLVVSHVSAIHAIKDLREQITNIFGGEMTRYEELLQHSAERAMEKLRGELAAAGWDGAYAVRFSHPSLVEGGCEVILSGTPFRIEQAHVPEGD